MNDPIVNALSEAYDDMRQRAIEIAMRETQPSRRVYAFLMHSPGCKFRAGGNTRGDKGLDSVLGVSATTVRKVMWTHFGQKADRWGWYYWSRPEWLEREAAAHVVQDKAAPEPEVMTDDEADAVLTQLACSLLDAMEPEPAPDEYATRPMPAITPEELEPESDVPDSSDRGDEYDEYDYDYGYDEYDDGYDEDDYLSPFGDDYDDYDEPDAEPVLVAAFVVPSTVSPALVAPYADYLEAQEKFIAADAFGWESRHLKHLSLLVQVMHPDMTADFIVAALSAQVEEIPF